MTLTPLVTDATQHADYFRYLADFIGTDPRSLYLAFCAVGWAGAIWIAFEWWRGRGAKR